MIRRFAVQCFGHLLPLYRRDIVRVSRGDFHHAVAVETIFFVDGAGKVDVAAAACLDSAGNILVTGQSTGVASSFDIVTVKYSPSGEQVWARRYDGASNQADRGSCIVADGQGRVFVGGNSVGPTSYPDMVLLGYSAAGDSLWTLTHAGTGAGEAKPVALQATRDKSGVEQLLVAGYDYNEGTGFDYLLMLLKEE